jgi:phosphodiesterase/alkaline phosphatase D-like protein
MVIRADSGYCRDRLMTWCEANDLQYVLGLSGNVHPDACHHFAKKDAMVSRNDKTRTFSAGRRMGKRTAAVSGNLPLTKYH